MDPSYGDFYLTINWVVRSNTLLLLCHKFVLIFLRVKLYFILELLHFLYVFLDLQTVYTSDHFVSHLPP